MSVPCSNCQATVGGQHVDGCSIERCRLCGGQSISCNCVYEANGVDTNTLEETHPDVFNNGVPDEWWVVFDTAITEFGGRVPWTGEFPGLAEAREFGWFTRWVEGSGWTPCAESDSGARPDLNRLAAPGPHRWDKRLGRYVLQELP